MSAAIPRRHLLGGSVVGALLFGVAGTSKAAELDGELLALCRQMSDSEAAWAAYDFEAPGCSLEGQGAIMGDYWDAAESIPAIPARTPKA